ncbi:MAG TPA: hypothetical protein VHE32_00715 [Rhodanobacteraceae bacterium]|nr:hypothetical protein [Rhodanobacteraceae bacterium]
MPNIPHIDPQRSVAALDLSPARSGIFTPGLESIQLSEDVVQRFNALAATLNEEMPPLTMDQLAGVARRVLRVAATGGESPFIRSRLRRAEEMRALLADPGWSSSEDIGGRMHALIAYIDDPDGLFPDEVPVIGRLDDALLVDIAMDVLREDLEDYAEFRRFRHAEAARLGVTDDAIRIDRTQWQAERDAELRLEQQLRRVRASRFGGNAAERIFRVC